MNLILTSDGFVTDEIIEACIRLVGKPAEDISVAAIAEGYAVEPGDHRWVLDDLSHASAIFGGAFRIVDLLALNPADIKTNLQAADVIFVLGGHTDYLMSVFDHSGLSKMLPELLQTKVYVGSSAGSMILGHRLSTAAYHEVYGEEGTYGTTKYLEFVDFAMKPHMGSPLFPKNRPDVLMEVTKDYSGTLYGLPDSTALLVEGGSFSVLGDEPAKIVDGQLV